MKKILSHLSPYLLFFSLHHRIFISLFSLFPLTSLASSSSSSLIITASFLSHPHCIFSLSLTSLFFFFFSVWWPNWLWFYHWAEVVAMCGCKNEEEEIDQIMRK
ncbi:hypothetical protein ACOSP7_010529 [Xanthoceras sorbifolium]